MTELVEGNLGRSHRDAARRQPWWSPQTQHGGARKHCTGLGLEDVQTYIQSGNLVFRDSGDPATLARRLEDGIEARFGFRPPVVLRTAPELRKVIAKNPFAGRPGIEPSKLLVVFMAASPARAALNQVLAMPCEP